MLTFKDTSSTHSASSTELVILSNVPIGISVMIEKITAPLLEIALLKLSIARGDKVQISNKAPFGDPIALSVNDTKITLRKKDASHIQVSYL